MAQVELIYRPNQKPDTCVNMHSWTVRTIDGKEVWICTKCKERTEITLR